MDKTANGINLPNEMEQADDEVTRLKAANARATDLIYELMTNNVRLKESLQGLADSARHAVDHLSRDNLEARHRLTKAIDDAIKTLNET